MKPIAKAVRSRFLAPLAMTIAGGFGMAASTPALAIDYAVSFNTSAIAGTPGSIDFQWNLGAADPSLLASVSSFSGTAVTEPATLQSGHVSGSLEPGGSLRFDGSDVLNYIYQTLEFGPSISFILSLPDSAPMQSGSDAFIPVFSVSLFDTALLPALPTTPSAFSNASLVFSLMPGQGPVLTQYTAATVSVAGVVSPVPEPETCAFLLAGLLAIGFYRRRLQAQH